MNTKNEMIVELKKAFNRQFGDGQLSEYFAPGRVNLIGEHIDYNGGLVFPCALSIGTYAVAKKNDTNTVRCASLNIDGIVNFDVENISYIKEDGWGNYVKGIIKYLKEAGKNIGGFDVYYYGNIPNSSGLSSSASLEVLTATLALDLFDEQMERVELVKLCKRVENDFIGVNSGIMDQFAIEFGKENMAISLDCETLKYDYAHLDLSGFKLVIANTNYKRGLADSKYNERRSECEKGLELIQKEIKVENLCKLNSSQLEVCKELIGDDTIFRRVRHVVTENERVKEALRSLNNGNLLNFGKLMNESHDSLREDYEVTGNALDTIVEEARKIDGVIGVRMTGAGFGGCSVALVDEAKVDEFVQKVGENYEKRTSLKAEFYVVTIGDGARKIK